MKISPAYERQKTRAAARSARISAAGREISPLPPVKDPRRRIAACRDFQQFCQLYFPHTFTLAWSPDHLKMIGHLQRAVVEGGTFAMAMPRGNGKSSLCEAAALFALLSGAREFLLILAADDTLALSMLDSIKTELLTNERLLEDFPEVVYPIRCLENVSQRANAQLFGGKLTHITWTDDCVVLPTIPGSQASGAIIRVKGLGGSIRGMKHKRPGDGRTLRPSLVIIDDPQTDESARSPSQCAQRERLISGAVMGLAGPGRKIAAVMPCTVICPGDLADRLLDRKKHPEWQGERTKMVYSFPGDTKLWDQYAEIYRESLRQDRGGKEASEFYAAHRSEMDAGARVAWPERFNPDELSAVQHAMNLKIRDEEAFFAEHQNDPRLPESLLKPLTADEICQKLNGLLRGQVPTAAQKITAFVDVHDALLYWAVCAWSIEEFEGWVIDYGTHPEQPRRYFTLRQAAEGGASLQRTYPGLSKEAAIRKGLESLCGQLCAREWKRDDGSILHLERLLIDQGYATGTVHGYIRASGRGGMILPAAGVGLTAASRPMSDYKKLPGQLLGHNWLIPRANARELRHVRHDANWWKTFINGRLAMPAGSRGALTLYGDKAQEHRLLADHLTSEYGTPTEGQGRQLVEWRTKPGGPDVHWLDCLVGCAVAASVCGCGRAMSGKPPIIQRRPSSRKAVYLE